jgi:hypothetical protein
MRIFLSKDYLDNGKIIFSGNLIPFALMFKKINRSFFTSNTSNTSNTSIKVNFFNLCFILTQNRVYK